MYQFTKDCLIGIDQIDKEHQTLFQMINEVMELMNHENASLTTAKNLVKALRSYAKEHFKHEEAYMESIHDPELPSQQKEHAAFVEKVNGIDIDALTEEDATQTIHEMMGFLARWLYHHILGSDTMIGHMKMEKKDPFAFTDEYKTGIELVDEEHAKLFDIIRETNEVIHAELLHDKFDEITRILGELKDYTVKHFGDEEQYMEGIGYNGLEMQQRAHEAFVEKLNEIDLDEVDDNQQEYLEGLIEFLLGWLVNHILKMDKKIPA